MKSDKRHGTDGMKLPNQEKNLERSAEKNKPTNTWRSWKWRWKKKLRKNISGELESYMRQNYIGETLLIE